MIKPPEKILQENVMACNIERLNQHWHFKQSIIKAMEKYKDQFLTNNNQDGY